MTGDAITPMLLLRQGLRVGPLRLSPYGLWAAAGVIAAVALAGQSARRTQLNPEAAWDAGLFATGCCFLSSRLLLILSDPKAFVRYPMFVLGSPSLTMAGLAIAAAAVCLYLWRKPSPVRAALDAFAPSGALLAAFLELGHWWDGSEPGMPVPQNGKNPTIDFRPVSMYGVVLSLLLLVVLWRALDMVQIPGRVAALGLMLGGAVAFALDMITLPGELFGAFALEPGQTVALAAILGGAVLWTFAPQRSLRIGGNATVTSVPKVQGEAR